MAYLAKDAAKTLFGYLDIDPITVEYVGDTNERGFVYTSDNGEQSVIFIYPISHKTDDTKNFFDTRDSGARERGVAWRYALRNRLKYFCFAVHDRIDKYNGYIFSLECNEDRIAEVAGTINGVRAGKGTQVVIPNDYIPYKPFDRLFTKNSFYIAVIAREGIKDYIEKYDNRPYMTVKDIEDSLTEGFLTPEWFNENGKAFLYLDDEAAEERDKFLKKYSPDLLRGLDGVTLLRTIFLNDDNKDNLCYELEFNAKLRELFGSIKSGTAYKYGLHYSQKNQKWATGSGRKPQFLTVDEAVELGTQIRDYLVDGADVIKKYDRVESTEDYNKLFTELNEVTEGYISRVWFLKYYQMIAPEIFPPIYSRDAQTTLLNAIGVLPDENSVVRMGQMQLFIQKCDVTPVVFSRTFWTNYRKSEDSEETEQELRENPIKHYTGYKSPYPLNRIVFGAPGTGKSYTVNHERKKLFGEDNEYDYERVTFHPDYSYAQFVGAYKPVPAIDEDGRDTITYEYVPGPFMRIYVKALKNGRTDDARPHLLVIEEINRADVAAVFGDVFQLLDRDDDGVSEYPIQASEDIKKYLASELGGQPEDYDKIRIPDNMLIWATMNSADQGVFPMDTAFKRRWDFTYIGIDDNEEGIIGKRVLLGKDNRQHRVEWNRLRKAINSFLARQKINEDKQLGPYFIFRKIVTPAEGDEIDAECFKDTFKSKVIMYLFEDAGKQKRASLFQGCFTDSSRYSDICREFDMVGVGIFNREIAEDANAEYLDGSVLDYDTGWRKNSE